LTDRKNSVNGSEEEGELSPEEEGELESFWKAYYKTAINDSLSKLDERARYLITTCASLIVIHFGLIIGFKIENISIKIAPEFFFVIAAAAFAFSLFPLSRSIFYQSPASIQEAFTSSLRWRTRGQYVGFGFFIAGLLAMAITALIS